MKKMILTIVSLFIFTQTLVANEQKTLENHFLNKIDEVVLIVKDKSLDKTTRNSDIINVLTPMFDFELMAKLSLGNVWRTLPSDDRKEFVTLYVERMKQSYSSKIDAYSDEKVAVTEILQPKSNRIELVTNLVSKDDKLEISYKFYKPQNIKTDKDLWIIYDVVISGVSILKTDIAQFREFLQTKNITELITQLKLNAK
ncbi:MAG: phospholipid transport system substrate-binding protein [Arcobacteraceae bacterium]|jgi:phospholipid transport system substrate-binding protein